MDIAGVRQPASSWEHYIAAPDGPDEKDRAFDNKAHRVLNVQHNTIISTPPSR